MSDTNHEIIRPDSVTLEPHGAIEVAHAMELSPRAAADLALVGLSTQFPARMKRLNDTIVRAHKGSFQGFKFSLSPDEASPDLIVEKLTSPPFAVTFEAFPNQTALFSVDVRKGFDDPKPGSITLALASHIIDFASQYPTEGEFFFAATPVPIHRRREEDMKLELPSIKVPLSDICRVSDLTDLGIDSFDHVGRYNLSVTLDHSPEPSTENPYPALEKVRMPIGYPYNLNGYAPQAERFNGDSVFWIEGFRAQGASEDIEKVVDIFSGLITATESLE